jgi:peptide/nickel transport system substrate-binding protein
MKKFTTFLLFALTTAHAAPFVMPQAWSEAPAQSAQRGGILRSTSGYEPRTWNPFASDDHANLLNSESLFIQDPKSGDYLPFMAEKYTVSSDKKTWTVTLRPELKWSNGQPITAEDFELSMNIIADPKGEAIYKEFYTINGKPLVIKAINAQTLEVKLPAVSAAAFDLLANIPLAPASVYGQAYKDGGWNAIKDTWTLATNASEIISTGPFALKNYRPGERLELERNPFYGEWVKDSANAALPYLEGRSVDYGQSRAGFMAKFITGGVDTLNPFTVSELSQIKKSSDIRLAANAGGGDYTLFLNFNWKNQKYGKLFANSEFRKAISQLVNRKAMVTTQEGN